MGRSSSETSLHSQKPRPAWRVDSLPSWTGECTPVLPVRFSIPAGRHRGRAASGTAGGERAAREERRAHQCRSRPLAWPPGHGGLPARIPPQQAGASLASPAHGRRWWRVACLLLHSPCPRIGRGPRPRASGQKKTSSPFLTCPRPSPLPPQLPRPPPGRRRHLRHRLARHPPPDWGPSRGQAVPRAFSILGASRRAAGGPRPARAPLPAGRRGLRRVFTRGRARRGHALPGVRAHGESERREREEIREAAGRERSTSPARRGVTRPIFLFSRALSLPALLFLFVGLHPPPAPPGPHRPGARPPPTRRGALDRPPLHRTRGRPRRGPGPPRRETGKPAAARRRGRRPHRRRAETGGLWPGAAGAGVGKWRRRGRACASLF